jgi:hypothetical protein
MKTKKKNFSVGDWVVMEENYKQYLSKKLDKGSKNYIKSYSYPQQIQKTYAETSDCKKGFLVFSKGKKMFETAFRLATEKEIKEQTIKNIFSNNM